MTKRRPMTQAQASGHMEFLENEVRRLQKERDFYKSKVDKLQLEKQCLYDNMDEIELLKENGG